MTKRIASRLPRRARLFLFFAVVVAGCSTAVALAFCWGPRILFREQHPERIQELPNGIRWSRPPALALSKQPRGEKTAEDRAPNQHNALPRANDDETNDDEKDNNECDPNEVDPATLAVIRRILDWMKDSKFLADQHSAHKASPSVTHLFKNTPLARGPPEWKLLFVDSWAGKWIETVMREEQSHLGEWKIEKILDAAGDYDQARVRAAIDETVANHTVVVYSFVDCPWCVAASDLLLRTEPYASGLSEDEIAIVELEALGVTGKHVRAELAKRTGRTSLPCVFVKGIPVGGFTDGAPVGPGLRKLHESGELWPMMANPCSARSEDLAPTNE